MTGRCTKQPVDTRPFFIERGRRFESVRGLCKKRRTSALSRSDRLAPRRTCGGYGAVYGAFASPRPFVMASPDARSLACDGPSSSRSVTRRTTQILGSVRCLGGANERGALDAATTTPIPQDSHGARPAPLQHEEELRAEG